MNLNLMMAVAGILLLICVYANRISIRYGIPSLLYRFRNEKAMQPLEQL